MKPAHYVGDIVSPKASLNSSSLYNATHCSCSENLLGSLKSISTVYSAFHSRLAVGEKHSVWNTLHQLIKCQATSYGLDHERITANSFVWFSRTQINIKFGFRFVVRLQVTACNQFRNHIWWKWLNFELHIFRSWVDLWHVIKKIRVIYVSHLMHSSKISMVYACDFGFLKQREQKNAHTLLSPLSFLLWDRIWEFY